MPVPKGFRVATLFGIPVRIDPTWFIVLLLLSWTLSTSYFPEHHQGWSRGIYWILGTSGAILLFLSVLLHELGHALVARGADMRVHGITLFLFGGVSEVTEEPPSAAVEVKVTAGGWLVSAALAVICYIVHRLMPSATQVSAVVKALFGWLAAVNAMLFVFNGIPGFPLDGGRLLRAFLWYFLKSLRRATYIASNVGAGFGILFIVLGVFQFITGRFVGGLWLAMIGLFLRNAARASYSQMLLRQALEGVPVSQLMSTELVTVPPSITLRELVRDHFMRHRFHSFPVVEGERLRGMISLHDVKEVDEGEWDVRTVQDVLDRQGPAEVGTVSPFADAMDAFAEMARTGRGRLAVVDGDRLVGIVSRRDILHFLAIKTDLLPEGV